MYQEQISIWRIKNVTVIIYLNEDYCTIGNFRLQSSPITTRCIADYNIMCMKIQENGKQILITWMTDVRKIETE